MTEEFWLDKTWERLCNVADDNLVRKHCSLEFKKALDEEIIRLFHATVEAQERIKP